MSNIWLEILDTDTQISNNILKAIAEDFNNLIYQKISKIRNSISNETILFLQKTETYESLINGDLAGHFGIPLYNRINRIDSILKTIGNNIEFEYRPVRIRAGKFVDGAKIGILITEFVDILSMMEAIITTNKGQNLLWLEWLLKNGNRIIINEFDVKMIEGRGRSGLAIMIKKGAKAWKVPSEFAGTINDNWLTRLLNSKEYIDLLYDILIRSIE